MPISNSSLAAMSWLDILFWYRSLHVLQSSKSSNHRFCKTLRIPSFFLSSIHSAPFAVSCFVLFCFVGLVVLSVVPGVLVSEQ